MKRKLFSLATIICLQMIFFTAFAQNSELKGVVKNSSTSQAIPAVSIVVKGSSIGTYTNDKGEFSLNVNQAFPITIEISAIGFAAQSVIVTSSNAITINMEVSSALGQEVVISATRTPSRLLESPVSIERVSNMNIRSAPSANYYDMMLNMKGVDVVTSSLTFKTPTTRGFGGSGNTRVNQIMDGMDNQAPGLNFSVGSIIGLTELDVESMELLQGASSALYGPGGMNGTIIINGKNPFKYQGMSFQVKTGLMHADGKQRDPSMYNNWAVRYADKVSDKFAFKIGAELIQAKDWVGDDERNYKRVGSSGTIIDGTRSTDPNYDGINVYGDETTTNLKSVLNLVGQSVPFWQGYISTLPASIPVSRTGYAESDVVDPNTFTFKFNGAMHYKITPEIEAVFAANWGTGNSVYTGSQRYSLRGFKIGQYKLELNHKNWFLRGFTTQENSGESHNLTIASQLFNEAWKPSTTWYQEYAIGYVNAKLAGRPDIEAHNIARSVADIGRPAANSAQFNSIFDKVRGIPIPQGGLFLDKSDLYMGEGQYNFQDVVEFAEILVGGNYKQYVLNSQGTLFADKIGEPIKINEFGGYVQIAKDLFNNVFRLTASGRYDKNENFEGRFTPRVTGLIKVKPNHNVRISYQTAYRFPSTQQQWIDLNAGTGRLIGENKSLWEKYNLLENPGYNPSNLSERVSYATTQPESVTSYELGYKGLFSNKILFDVYGYYGQYKDFLSRRDVVQFSGGTPGNGTTAGYSIVVNAPGKITTYGWGASLDYNLPAGFTVGLNASSDVLDNVPDGFKAAFNTPKLRTNVSVGNTGFGKKKIVGFNIAWRYQEGFLYQSDFVDGLLPAYHNVDASVNFKLTEIRSIIKVGSNNLLNSYYRNAVGNPSMGGLYYVSFAYNVF